MKYLWSPDELLKAFGGEYDSIGTAHLCGFVTDSRKAYPGCVFVALKGDNFDGHDFCKVAADNGAAAFIVSKSVPLLQNRNFTVIRTEDTLKALQKAANYYRRSLKNTVVLGITGSNGKTTSRSMVAHMLGGIGKCCATEGNLNNHIGLPLTVLSADYDCDYLILEMGMNHPGEITFLCQIAEPDHVMISSIGPAHIGILGSMENIACAKAEILRSLHSPKNIGVYPEDTEFSSILCEAGRECSLVSFGISKESDVKIKNIELSENSVSFISIIKGKEYSCFLNTPGRHNAFNALGALSLCSSISPENTALFADRLSSYLPVGSRMERVIRDGVIILMDCYNANPASMEEAMRYMSNISSQNKIAVLGDMRELGALSESYHRELGKLAANAGLKYLIGLGSDIDYTLDEAVKNGLKADKAVKLNSDEETADFLREVSQKDSVILFKASRGLHFERIVRRLWPDLGEGLH